MSLTKLEKRLKQNYRKDFNKVRARDSYKETLTKLEKRL